MAHRISQMPMDGLPMEALPAPVESFLGSSLNQSLGAMNPPNQGLKEANDGGNYANVNENPQGLRNHQQQMQNLQQNTFSAATGRAGAVRGQVNKQLTEQSTSEYKAAVGKNNYVANIMEATGNGAATMAMSRLDTDKIRNDVGVSRMMFEEGKAAELGQLQAEAGRYS